MISLFGKISLGLYVVHLSLLCMIKHYIGVIPCLTHWFAFLPELLVVIALTYSIIIILSFNKYSKRLFMGL